MFGLSTIAMEAIAAAVVALMIFGGGMKLQYDIDADRQAKTELAYQTAQTKAVADSATRQQTIDAAALAATAAEAQAQAHNVTVLQQELSDAQSHVNAKVIPCISYGLVRVLDAAVLGVGANQLALPPGKSDDACSPITANELAVSIVSNYGAALANSEQLNAVLALIRKQNMVLKK